MSLVSSHDWQDHIDLIEGEPDLELSGRPRYETLRREPTEPRPSMRGGAPNERGEGAEPDSKQLMACCLNCWVHGSHPVATYIYENYPIELEDGTTTTAEDWRAEAGRNRVGRSRRRRMYCPRCDFLTYHVAEL